MTWLPLVLMTSLKLGFVPMTASQYVPGLTETVEPRKARKVPPEGSEIDPVWPSRLPGAPELSL
jgi:hypothetical protein